MLVYGGWYTKRYKLCYQRSGEGPFVPTFALAGLDPESGSLSTGVGRPVISDVTGRLQVLSTDGQRNAKMKAFLHFTEFGPGSSELSSIDELTHLDARIEQNRMHVAARVYVESDRRPFCLITWHADFIHVPQ
jgi:hypothetical protein